MVSHKAAPPLPKVNREVGGEKYRASNIVSHKAAPPLPKVDRVVGDEKYRASNMASLKSTPPLPKVNRGVGDEKYGASNIASLESTPPVPKVYKSVGGETYRVVNVATSESKPLEKGFKITLPFKIKQPPAVQEFSPTHEPASENITLPVQNKTTDNYEQPLFDSVTDDQLILYSVLNIVAILIVVASSLGLVSRVKVHQKYTEKQVQKSRLKLIIRWMERELKEAIMTLEERHNTQEKELLELKSSFQKKCVNVYEAIYSIERRAEHRDIEKQEHYNAFRNHTTNAQKLIEDVVTRTNNYKENTMKLQVCSRKEEVAIEFLTYVIKTTNSAVEKLFSQATERLEKILKATRDPKVKRDLSRKLLLFEKDHDVWQNGASMDILAHFRSRAKKKVATSRNASKTSLKKSSPSNSSRSTSRSTGVSASSNSSKHQSKRSTTTPENLQRSTSSAKTSSRSTRSVVSTSSSARDRTSRNAPQTKSTNKTPQRRVNNFVRPKVASVPDKSKLLPPSFRRRCNSLGVRSKTIATIVSSQDDESESNKDKVRKDPLYNHREVKLKVQEETIKYQRQFHGRYKSTSCMNVKMPFVVGEKSVGNRRESVKTTGVKREQLHVPQAATRKDEAKKKNNNEHGVNSKSGSTDKTCDDHKADSKGVKAKQLIHDHDETHAIKNQGKSRDKPSNDNSQKAGKKTSVVPKNVSPRQKRVNDDKNNPQKHILNTNKTQEKHVDEKITKSAKDSGTTRKENVSVEKNKPSSSSGLRKRLLVHDRKHTTNDGREKKEHRMRLRKIVKEVRFQDTFRSEDKYTMSKAIVPLQRDKLIYSYRAFVPSGHKTELDPNKNNVPSNTDDGTEIGEQKSTTDAGREKKEYKDELLKEDNMSTTMVPFEIENLNNSSHDLILPDLNTEMDSNRNNIPNNEDGGTEIPAQTVQKTTLQSKLIDTWLDGATAIRKTIGTYFDFFYTKNSDANNLPEENKGPEICDGDLSNNVYRTHDVETDQDSKGSTNECERVLTQSNNNLDADSEEKKHHRLSLVPSLSPSKLLSSGVQIKTRRVQTIGVRKKIHLVTNSTNKVCKLLGSSDLFTMQSTFEARVGSIETPFSALKGDRKRQQRNPPKTGNCNANKLTIVRTRNIVKVTTSTREKQTLRKSVFDFLSTSRDGSTDRPSADTFLNRTNPETEDPKDQPKIQYSSRRFQHEPLSDFCRGQNNRDKSVLQQCMKKDRVPFRRVRRQLSQSGVQKVVESPPGSVDVANQMTENTELKVCEDVKPTNRKPRKESSIHCSLCPKKDSPREK